MITYFFEVFKWGWGDTAYWLFIAGGMYLLYQGREKLAAMMVLIGIVALVTLSMWL